MKVDYLIVGQGLAGTLMAHALTQASKSIHCIDKHHEGASSKIAAGIINPITGRRYVKSWRIDQLIPCAEQAYRELESLLGVELYHKRNIIRTLFNHGDENNWLMRSGDDAYAPYMLDEYELGAYKTNTVEAFSYGELTQSSQVNVPVLIEKYKELLLEKQQLTQAAFDYTQLDISDEAITYKDIKANRILFCEGHQARQNPYFNYLPFGGTKGEILIVKIPNANFEKMFKHRIFIVPLQGDTYWIGATNDWKATEDNPTEEGRTFLTDRLKDVLQLPFEILEHKAAIRPTVKDRRPFLGVHPQYNRLFLFNGLGTKGASLGPYWAGEMVRFLEEGKVLDKEVDIGRWS